MAKASPSAVAMVGGGVDDPRAAHDRGERHQHAPGVFEGQSAVGGWAEVQQVGGRRGGVDGDQPSQADQHQLAVGQVSAGPMRAVISARVSSTAQ